MRNEIIGLALAAALLGGLYYAATHRAHRVPVAQKQVVAAAKGPSAAATAAGSIGPGFVGLKRVGAWTVACGAKPVVVHDKAAVAKPAPGKPAIPFSLNGKNGRPSDKPAAKGGAAGKISLGRCRTLIEYRRKAAPKKAVLTLSFRLVGKAHARLGLFVRMPSGKKGQSVGMRLGKGGFKLPIAGCGKDGCMALGLLSPANVAMLAGQAQAKLVLPPGANGKRRAVAVPLTGLGAALTAMRRAES